MSSCSAWRWVTSAMGPLASTAALSAATLFSRPTWRGTIISGKMTVSRSATSGSSRTSPVVGVGSGDGFACRLAISGSPWVPAYGSALCCGLWVSGGWGSWSRWLRRGIGGGRRGGGGVGAGRSTGRFGCPLTGSFVVQVFEDPLAEALLELEEGLDTGEVDAAVAGQVSDPQDPPDVLLGVEADVGRRARRADEALVLVDAQGPRVCGHERGRHADHVDGPGGVPVRPAGCSHGSGSLRRVRRGCGQAIRRLGERHGVAEGRWATAERHRSLPPAGSDGTSRRAVAVPAIRPAWIARFRGGVAAAVRAFHRLE